MPDLSIKPTNGVGAIVFDLEANGLLNDATRIHCIALHWCEDNTSESFNDEPYGDGTFDIKEEAPMASNYSITTALSWLETADILIGHNIIGYDLPLIKRLYNWFNPTGVILDTLLLSHLYHPNLLDIDRTTGKIPQKLYGKHSLEAYGHRLDEHKGDFAVTTDWKNWSRDMQKYCVQDVVVTTKLCEHFRPYLIG